MTADHLCDPDLEPILAAIKNKGVAHLDVIHRARLMDKIIKSVIQRAKFHKLYHYNEKKQPVDLNFLPFTEEDEALAAIVSTMEWSDRFRDFFTMNAKKFGRMMAEEKTLKTFIKDWQQADDAAKLNTLKSMGAKQLALFKHDGLTPEPPEIIITGMTDMRENIAGYFNRGASGLSIRAQDKTICIHENLTVPGETEYLCQILWHEHVHSLCQQFAASCRAGILSATNPFYADAKIKQARLEYSTDIYNAFPKAYAAEPEENLAYQTMEVFIDSWEQHSGWRARLGRALKIS